MECKKCSAVNPEEAVFCRNCGKRLDGKVSCPACDAMNDEDSNFCIHCGTKLSNKSICPSCNTVYEGNFCPACGKTAPAQPQTRAHKAKQTVTPPAACETSKWRKILEYVGGGLAMSAVFFAVLFAFLIGVNVGNISNLIGANGVNVTMEVTIFDFFGKAYEDLDFTYYDSSLAFVELFPTILGTLIVVVTLVCVVVFAALAIARYIKFVTGKSQKDYSTFAAATVISFLTGALAFLALNSVIGGASMSGVSATAATGFNSATIAGIVLASIFFAAFAGCRIAVHAKDIFTQKRLITVILSAVGVALLSIALHFAGEAIAIASIKQGNGAIKIGGGFTVIAALLMTNATRDITFTDAIYYLSDKFVPIEILAFIGAVVQLVLLVMLACAIVKFITNLTDRTEQSNLKFAIVSVVFAALHLALVITTCTLYVDVLEATNVTIAYAQPIVALVFAVLSLGVTIAHKVLLNRQRRAEQLAEEPEAAE